MSQSIELHQESSDDKIARLRRVIAVSERSKKAKKAETVDEQLAILTPEIAQLATQVATDMITHVGELSPRALATRASDIFHQGLYHTLQYLSLWKRPEFWNAFDGQFTSAVQQIQLEGQISSGHEPDFIADQISTTLNVLKKHLQTENR